MLLFGHKDSEKIMPANKRRNNPPLEEKNMWRAYTFKELKQQYYLYNFVAPLRSYDFIANLIILSQIKNKLYYFVHIHLIISS